MRTLGSLGMSVGTSLAFEEMPAGSLNNINSFLVNLRTVIRNAQQAYESSSTNYNNVKVLIEDVKKDIGLLAKYLNGVRGTTPLTLTLYYPKYERMKLIYPFAELWEPRTEKQKNFHGAAEAIAKAILKEYKDLIKIVNVGVPQFGGEGVVLTHHAVDLTETNSIGRLKLLESHTGHLKRYTEWHTKLTGGDELFYIPLNKLTIQVFGDKSTNFRSQSHGIKELVKNIAVNNKWTSATSFSKVRADIRNLPASVDRAGLMKMI